jgi:hypothetical protein
MARSSNKSALEKVTNALRDLILLKHNGTEKTPAQMQAIDEAIDLLQDEFLRLQGMKPSGRYSDIVANLSRAKSELGEIVRDRRKIAGGLVTARKLLGSVRPVLALIP